MVRAQLIPPSPDVMADLFMEYLRSAKEHGVSFRRYLQILGYVDPSIGQLGMDDRFLVGPGEDGPALIDIPAQPIQGNLSVIVLLVDFPDREGHLRESHYEDLLFSEGVYPSGSLTDYYEEVSLGRVHVDGSVHGWLRMPHPYAYYVNNESGVNGKSYPRNAQRLAEDAAKAAVEAGISFPAELDLLSQGIVTAFFIVHAGLGAESLHHSIANTELWSHKWNLRQPQQLNGPLVASTYLVVPQNCRLGVCAHELGHLAFQWQDFYDPNYDDDGHHWDGSGNWDLMAGGSHNAAGNSPAHPAGLHKLQHGWVKATEVNESCSVTIEPYTNTTGKVFKVSSPAFRPGQYLLLENRIKQGSDIGLPGEGLLVWRVDEEKQMMAPHDPGMYLVQADGRHDLEIPNDWNQGDEGDPFPGSTERSSLLDTGGISTSFPGEDPSGIRLVNISRDHVSGSVFLDIEFV